MKTRTIPYHSIAPAAIALLHLLAVAPTTQAATRFWSGNGTVAGGNGTWDTTSTTHFGNATTGPFNLAWDNALNDTVSINTNAASITLGANVTVGGVTVVSGGTNSIGAGSGPYKLTLGLTGANTFSVSTSTGRSLTVIAELAGVSGNNLLITTGTGTAGIVSLNGVNTYLGNTSVTGNGTFRIAGAGQLGSGSYAGTLSIGTGSKFNHSSSLNQTLSGNITGAGSLTKATSATSILVLSGTTNTYSGGTTVSTGTLTFRNTGAKPATGTVSVSAGATLGLGVATSGSFFTSANVDSLFAGTLSGVTNDVASNVGIDTTQGNFTYATSVGGSPTRGLVKLGANTLTLTGSNTYTGATTVSEGSLVINGAVASTSVVVNGSLGGSGVMANATIGGSGSVNPGNSPGVLTAAATDPSEGLDFNFEFTAANTVPTWNNPTASVNDVLRLTSATPFTAALGGTNMVTIYLNVGSLTEGDVFTGGFYTDNNADFLSSISSGNFLYYLADAGGAITYGGNTYSAYSGPLGFNVSTIAQSADFGAGSVSGYTSQFTVVPEPNIAALFGVFGTLLLLRRR